MTATFSEWVDGLTEGEITVGNGSVDGGSLSTADNIEWTFDVIPAGQGSVTVDIGVDAAQDVGSGGNTAADQFGIVYDSIEPDVTISSTESPGPTNANPIPIEISFTEDVTGFIEGDIVVGNGTITALSFTEVDPATYTLTVTPTSDGEVTVDVGVGVANDAATNGNTVASQFTIDYDGTVPTVALSTTASDPTNVSPIPM
ncbi:MAG: hypothetical protein GY798_29845, partial [Hyphomicrobiales bacterium]|nr:hypothetical protein [Hyphomicrobiales bacterium]